MYRCSTVRSLFASALPDSLFLSRVVNNRLPISSLPYSDWVWLLGWSKLFYKLIRHNSVNFIKAFPTNHTLTWQCVRFIDRLATSWHKTWSSTWPPHWFPKTSPKNDNMQMRFMTCGGISSMTHFLQIRLRLSIATSLVITWVCPDLLGERKEIEKIISILAIMSVAFANNL